MNTCDCKPPDENERFAKLPRLFNAYADDIDKGFPVDSGLPDLLRFAARKLDQITPDYQYRVEQKAKQFVNTAAEAIDKLRCLSPDKKDSNV